MLRNWLTVLLRQFTRKKANSSVYLFAVSLVTMSSMLNNQAIAQNKNKERIEKLRLLHILKGDWELNSTMIPLNAPKITEHGSMSCSIVFDSTYVECHVELENQRRRKRFYREFITYNPDSARYELLYLYSDNPSRIVEYGKLDKNELIAETTLTLAGGKQESIQTLFRISDNNNLYLQSRSSMTNNEIDYLCWYKRKK